MTISNEPPQSRKSDKRKGGLGGSSGLGGPGGGSMDDFSRLLQLQTDFHARLTEETLSYLRRIQGTLSPKVPGTVVEPGEVETLEARGRPGGTARLKVEIENTQPSHTVATPQLTPLTTQTGRMWFAGMEAASTLVGPGEVKTLKLSIPVPDEVKPGVYRGGLMLIGFRQGAVPLTVRIQEDAPQKPEAGKKGSAQKKKAGDAGGEDA